MVRKEIVIAGVLTLTGLVGGWWLLPEEADVARMEVRDYNYKDPEQHYETQFQSGDHSVDTVQQLVRIHTNTGNIDRAIEVLRTYVDEHPEDSAALQQLGQLYQFAQRYQDYMAILEARAEGSTDPVVLREMSELYNFFQQTDKQKAVLERLYEVEKGENLQTIRDLSGFYTVDKEFDKVARLMNDVLTKHSAEYSYDDVVAHTNALLELKRTDEATDVVTQWHSLKRGNDEELASLVDMLHYQGSPAHARRILANIADHDIYASPDLLHSYLLIIMAEGKQDDAYKLLSTLYERGQLPDMLLPDLMYMAAANGNTKRFHELREKAGLTRLPENQLADIWITARRGHQRSVMNAISQHVAESNKDDYPLLRTLILVGDRSPARHAAVRNLLEGSLDNESLLKLAEVTADAGDTNYTRQALEKRPEYDELSRTELASLEIIYLRLGDVDVAKQYIAYLRQSGRLEPDSTVGLRTAAAIGDTATLRDWHNAHPQTASGELLTDLFYEASNKGHLQLALEIGEWQTDPKQQALARRSVADVYTRLGRYQAALSLLERDAPRTDAEIRDRVFLVSKLASRNPTYRERLKGLARQHFKSGASRATKEEIVYALINVGGTESALPYMKQLADQYSGEWTLTYADALMNANRADEAAPYYLQAAKDPKLDAETRMNIAYALANRGYRADAEKLLMALAETPQNQRAATEQLAYLWGPRPSEQQVAWLVDSWKAASAEDKPVYGELLAGKMSPEMLDHYVRNNPELRRIPEVDDEYLQLLAEQGRLREDIDAIAQYDNSPGKVAYLQRLGDMARDSGAYKDARVAYDSAIASQPDNKPALLGATITAAAQSDYAAISRYFNSYESQLQGAPEMVMADTHEAYFAYAENLRRQDRLQDAQPYYAQAVKFIEDSRIYTPEALSIAAQSSAWMQDTAKSNQVFDYAFSRYPHNAILRADKANLLVEQARYDEARTALQAINTSTKTSGPKRLDTALLTSGDTGTTQAPVLMNDGRQILVPTVAETIEPRYWVGGAREHPSVSYVTEGYDRVLLVTNVGYRFRLNKQGGGWMVNAVEEDSAASPRSQQAQLVLRKELLAARVDLETGDLKAAANRMDALEPAYKEDPQYLGFAANTAYYSNIWPTAKRLIDTAAEKSPENADILRLQRSIARDHADHVRADVTYTRRGENNDVMTSFSGETQVKDTHWRVGGVVRNHHVETSNELQANGIIGGRSDDRQTGHIYGIYADDGHDMWTLHLFANNDTAGVGADYSFVNAVGVTTLGGRYQEPYFEFIEGIMDDAVRDRVAVSHVYKPRTDWEIAGGLSYNNYSIATADDVMSTVGVDLSVSHAIQQSGPYIGVGYGLNAEYEVDSEQQTTSNGLVYRRLPLRTREIHFGSVTVAHDFNDKTNGSVLAGYGWDRFGGHGPAVEGTINHNFYKSWDVGGRAFYGLNASSSQSDDNLTQVNGYLRYRF
jgi:hypothetical protein